MRQKQDLPTGSFTQKISLQLHLCESQQKNDQPTYLGEWGLEFDPQAPSEITVLVNILENNSSEFLYKLCSTMTAEGVRNLINWLSQHLEKLE